MTDALRALVLLEREEGGKECAEKKNKNTTLSPMVRLKSRYLVLRLVFKDGRPRGEPSTEAALGAALKTALASSFGDLGAAAAASGAVSVRWLDPTAGVTVVRCGREGVAQVSEMEREMGRERGREGRRVGQKPTPHLPTLPKPPAPRRRRPPD